MKLHTEIYLVFAIIWFSTKILDHFLPPPDPIFNAALAITAGLACIARRIERS